jgi:hypothetical protein
MALQRDLSFGNKCGTNITPLFSNLNTLSICRRFREAESEENNQDRWASPKPEEWAPSVASSIHETASKSCREKISKSVTLLQHTRNDTASLLGTIFQCRRCRVSV